MADETYDLKRMQRKLKKYLDADRYQHTMGVMYTAAALAMNYNCDIKKAQVAGLLHDCAKNIPNKKKLKMCQKYKIPVTDLERDNPFLLHAKLGAFLAETKYDVTDLEILDAITWHTTGTSNMSMLEKIIYIADYIEPNRKEIPGLQEIRGIVFRDIDQAVCLSAGSTVRYLENGGKAVDPMTVKTYNFYKKEV